MMPLAMAGVGEAVCIKQINGRDEVRQHLKNLGFVTGEEVTVISKLNGNMVLSVKDSRLALDRSITTKIMV